MTCHLCKTRPVPEYYGSPRRCAFDERGNFTPDNWNCETMNDLHGKSIFHDTNRGDSSIVVITERGAPDEQDGHIVLTLYKRRGTVNGARVVGEGKPNALLTLAIAERTIARP
jgi:hypothetical protein